MRHTEPYSAPRLLVVAAAVAAAYYVGVQIGLELTFPPATTSVLWPPNSFLTIVLLLVPVRYWWVCLVSALPVHAVLEIHAGMPPPLVAALFLTNCSEAVIAAGGLRVVSDAPTRFDTFRRVATFIAIVALAAPVLSSFLDAGAVHYFVGHDYWQVWRTRVFSNMLTALSLVPLCVIAASVSTRPPVDRTFEMGALTIGLGFAALWIFGGANGPRIPSLPPTPSVLLLPFFFWAAVRFGVAGVSVAILTVVFVVSYETRIGHRPFLGLAPLDSLIAVQMYLAVMGMPLMCVAGLLDERRSSASELAKRLQFESLLSAIAAAFVRLPSGSAPAPVEDGVRRIGEFLDADSVDLLERDTSGRLNVSAAWRLPGADVLTTCDWSALFPWTFSTVLAGKTLVCESEEGLPLSARSDRASFVSAGWHSTVALPLVAGSRVQGILFVAMRRPRRWSDKDVSNLTLIAEVLANGCAKQRADLDLQKTREELTQVARLSSMGVLTASLAHQLNQPLAGILNNAQAARRLLDAGGTTTVDLREVMDDIIADDHRAADVIRRVREMVTRTGSAPSPVDVNAIVSDVMNLVAGDAILRNVSLTFERADDALVVAGNRVDLEQILLNVVTNAMDAVADRPARSRRVFVRTQRRLNDDVRILVSDEGPGLPAGLEDRMFEPFFSSKPSGMGLGLAVARSLTEQSGGTIRATNQPGGGAVVTITLPGAPIVH